ncbi:MAG: rhodanese-like domain-containing protein [Gammaproteobacteria bacterium]|nr:rhodanese-like domain-containing protein [Gammaproteobacteria bacterium]
MDKISPLELKHLLLGEEELALIDVREQGTFSESHLLFAVCVPLSRLELLIGDLVPRRDTRLVIVDESASDDLGSRDNLSSRGAQRLSELGYTNVILLDGGVEAWRSASLELFSGVNVPSKAFGEFVEHNYETPRLAAAEVKAMLDEGRNMVIVDSRPFEEYHRMNIPTATDMPGAELAFRIHDVAPDPETFVVVNCAGRTRSIIGAQSLINAGIPNPVAALKDGTMGWHLAGFELEHSSTQVADGPSAAGIEKALAAAARVAERFGVPTVTPETVEQWLQDSGRTTYLLDVRSPAEYENGHLAGYRNAPGGQLVQATDEYVAVKNAWLVLSDDIGVRATMTASWLIQMGWQNVYVLEGGIGSALLERGAREPTLLGEIDAATVTTDALAHALGDNAVTVIDLGPSTGYEQHHIPGALWCVRARLAEAIAPLPATADIVLTSTDGLLARLALKEARALTAGEVQALDGGTDRWLAEDRVTESGLEHIVGDTDDVWYKPYEHRGAQEKFMRDYLTWEVALVEQIERDGTTRFRAF